VLNHRIDFHSLTFTFHLVQPGQGSQVERCIDL
jgi:hypothetical protein